MAKYVTMIFIDEILISLAFLFFSSYLVRRSWNVGVIESYTHRILSRFLNNITNVT